MTRRDPAEVYTALTAVGVDPARALILTATAGGETGGTWNDAALGDVKLENSVWGPSFGVFQIRTLKAETGTGSDRDISWLSSSLANQAKAAADISHGGADLSPWTVYRTGAYKGFLAQVRNAIAPGSVSTSPVTDPAPIPHLPTFGPGWLPWNLPADVGNAAIDKANQTFAGARTIAIEVVFAVLALGLIGAGIVKLSGRRVRAAADRVDRAGKSVAGVVK